MYATGECERDDNAKIRVRACLGGGEGTGQMCEPGYCCSHHTSTSGRGDGGGRRFDKVINKRFRQYSLMLKRRIIVKIVFL
jgi:hypothetical protein